MKKILIVAIVALAGIYITGYVAFSETSVNRYLDKMEAMTFRGEGEALCELFDENFSAVLIDHLSGRGAEQKMNKEEMCKISVAAHLMYSALQVSSNVQRKEFAIKRDWLHPWTADVSYVELRSLSSPRGPLPSTESEDELVLVKTFSGTKIKRIKSEVWAQ